LETPRGSGTNGYITRNISHVRSDRKDNRKDNSYNYNDGKIIGGFESSLVKKPNKDILEHDRKRQVELKCLELQDTLEEEGFTEEEIGAKVNELRKTLLEKAGLSKVEADPIKSTAGMDSHQIAEANENKNKKMRDAFGIREEFPEGSSFTEEHQAAKKEEELNEKIERAKEKEKLRKRS